MKRLRLALGLACCLLSLDASADNLYCKIVSVSETASTGEVRRLDGSENTRKAAEGSDFVIQRGTGLMLGKYVDNDSAYWDTQVIEYGSDQMSYKAFSKNRKGHAYAQYIEVKMWETGKRKPFVLLDSDIITGYCTA